jgi:hypothetical protein
MENTAVFYKEIPRCLHLIFLPESYTRVHCHAAEQEKNCLVSVDQVPLVSKCGTAFGTRSVFALNNLL